MFKKAINFAILTLIFFVFFPSVIPMGLEITQVLYIQIRRIVLKKMARLLFLDLPVAVKVAKKTFMLLVFLVISAMFINSAEAAVQELYNFDDAQVKGWTNDTSLYFADNLGLPGVTASKAQSGSYSLFYPLDLDARDTQLNYVHDAGYVSPANKNFSGYSSLKLYAYIPAEANISTSAPLYMTIYIKTGSAWTWFESKDPASLTLGQWNEVSIDLSGAKNAQGNVVAIGDLDKIKEIGFHIFGAKTSSGTTMLYIDSIQAQKIIQLDPPAQVTGLSVVNTGTEVKLNLTWEASQSLDIAGYCVYRSTSYGETGSLVARRTVNNYTDKNVTEGTNYYYRVSAYDNDNREGELSLAVGNKPAVNNEYLLSFRGMSYAAWWNDTYQGGGSDASLTAIDRVGANFVALVVTQYMDSGSSNLIYADADKTPSDASLIHAINTIHSLGMNVLLKPHVDCKDNTWRGSISPADRSAWFSSYNTFINHYAQLAEDNGAEMLSIGCELKSYSGSSYLSQWLSVINNTKNIYHGPITYAANWDEYRQVSFWGYLDYAGIDAYFPLSDKQDPSLDELTNGWCNYGGHNWLGDIKTWQAQTGKPVIFTEIGYRSYDWAANKPWDYQNNSNYNGTLQAACYEAVFSVFQHEDWFKGTFWWSWSPNASAGGPQDTDYTPQNKTAQTTLTVWYAKAKQSNQAPQKPAEPMGPLSGVSDTYYLYRAKALDPDGDKINYVFDWGDGTRDTTGLLDSEIEGGVVHKWSVAGQFTLKIKAVDVKGAESEWSQAVEVNIQAGSNGSKLQAPVDFSQVVVYPNPWKISSGPAGGIKFDYLPKNTRLAVYNIAGEMIYKQEGIQTNSTNWDLRNDSGESVASGVYIYLLADEGGHKKIGKVAVIK
jgi:hypothetical protein